MSVTLTWLDWLFVSVLAVTAIAGFLRGLVREALGLAAWIIALLTARVLAEPVAALFSGVIDSADGRLVLAFVLVIFAVVLLCGLVIRLVHAAVEWVGMGLFNRVSGAAFGAAKGGAVLVLVTILISLTPLAQLEAWQRAVLRPPFEQLRDWTVSQLEGWEARLPEASSALPELAPSGGEDEGPADDAETATTTP